MFECGTFSYNLVMIVGIVLAIFVAKIFDITIRRLLVKEQKVSYAGYRCFEISITRFNYSYVSYFNKKGYFARLINSLKDADKVCYLLFSQNIISFPERVSRHQKDSINKALSIASSSVNIYQEAPRKEGKVEWSGLEAYCLMIKKIKDIEQIVGYLYDAHAELYFIFDTELNKDSLYSYFKTKDFKELDEKSIISLSADSIKLSMGCCSAEEEFKIFSNHFDKEQIKTKMLDCVGEDKLGVL